MKTHITSKLFKQTRSKKERAILRGAIAHSQFDGLDHELVRRNAPRTKYATIGA